MKIKNILWHIKNFQKYIIAHQYMPLQKPSSLPPTHLMYDPYYDIVINKILL